MSRRFPESNHIEFLPLPCEVLVEVGQGRLEERGYTLQGDAETAKAFESVMRYEAGKHPPENAGGAINAVDAMITVHDATEDNDDDCRITAVDIRAACPKAAAAAAAAEQAAAAAAPAAAGEAATGGAPRRSSRPSSQAPSSAAVVGPSSAGAAAGATSDSEELPSGAEEAAPLSKRARPDPAPSNSPAPASSGKRKADDLSAEAEEIVRAIDAVYEPNPSSTPIPAWDLLTELHKLNKFEKDSEVYEKASQDRLGSVLKKWTVEAIDFISARGGDFATVRHEELPRGQKLVIHGLRCRN